MKLKELARNRHFGYKILNTNISLRKSKRPEFTIISTNKISK